jgi:hypothetical protein
MQICKWEEHLARHFAELRHLRAIAHRPVFGLEHGLSPDEVADLQASVHEDLQRTAPVQRYFLTWVVYASEIGYLFRGGEFWQTFESRTPGWQHLGNRHWIKRCFLHFRDQYGGAQPSGPWARHFSIICWPITHAILPQDLQRQLAKVLYGLRYSLDESASDSPLKLGQLIASHSWTTTSRFQQLLQEPTLIGQVAVALLHADRTSKAELLLPATLDRIREDLDRGRRAKFWLREAQQQVHRRAGLSGLRPATQRAGRSTDSVEQIREAVRLSIRPHLQLYATERGTWTVKAEFPDYSAVLSWLPDTRIPLTSSRIFVCGSSGTPMAPRSLLHGPRSVRLASWPDVKKPLIEFEQSTPTLDALLHADCVLGQGPWLFKMSTDGIAKEIVSKVVRPNNTYLILHTGSSVVIPRASLVSVECEGVRAVALKVNDSLSDELLSVLETYGIQPAREIRVTPVGIPPARWDGEGSGEWLSTDNPVVAIRSNYSVARYDFSLDSGEQILARLSTTNLRSGETTFVQLPKLPDGFYNFDVTAVPGNGGRTEQGRLGISIRNPVQADDALTARGALLLTVYPPAPTLEQLWEGVATLEVLGPRSRQIFCKLRLLGRTGQDVLFEQQQSLRLPLTLRDWVRLLEERWQRNERCMFAYGAADSCELTFDGEELGRQQLLCERSLTALRWAFQHQHNAYRIRLIDDTEALEAPSVMRYAFDHPDVAIRVGAGRFFASTDVAEPGLYVATSGEQTSTIVIPPEVTRLEQFKLAPRIKRPEASASSALHLLELIERWADARVANTLVAGRFRNRVVEVFMRELFRLFGGSRWHRAERSRINRGGEDWIREMVEAIPSRKFGLGWAETILGQLPHLAQQSPGERVRFLATLTGQSPRLCEFALRLASRPSTARAFGGQQVEGMLAELRRLTTVARIARFLCLTVTDHVGAQTSPGVNSYPGWQWT